MTIEQISELIKKLRNGSFSKTGYSVTIYVNKIQRFLNSLYLYVDYDEVNNENHSVGEFFNKATPEFQRSNDKWTLNMKIKFVENLFAGCPTEIKLFRVGSSDGNAQIIDGLQRLTAILDFMQGKFKIFDLSYDDIKEYISNFGAKITLSVYDFSNWTEVGKYYVDMNENITHSADDILKAKKWFLENHNIKL